MRYDLRSLSNSSPEDIARSVGLPERLLPYLPTVETAKVGSHLSFAAAPFADPVDNIELMRRFIEHNPDATPEQIRASEKMIAHSGVKIRHVSPPLSADYPIETVLDEAEAIGAFLTRTAMRERGWEKIDWLKLTSATLPNDMSERVLARAGLNNVRASDDRIACAASLVAFINAITNPDLANTQGIILAIEQLTYLETIRNYQDQLAVGALFGNNNVAMTVMTGKFKPIAWKIRIIPDGGVIQVKKQYKVEPNAHLGVPEHLHLEFAKGGEAITEVSDRGILIDFNEPDEPDLLTKMHNQAVADFFTEVFPKTVLDTLEEEPEEYADKPIVAVGFHDPSNVVSIGILRSLRDKAKSRSERIQRRIRGLPPHGFLLDLMGHANSSSATLLQKLLFLARQGKLPPYGLWLLGAPGIGSGNAVIECELAE
jgi:hypothetical protein